MGWDEHVESMETETFGNAHNSLNITRALRNTKNKLSQEKVVELAERNTNNLGTALYANRYPADRIRSLSPKMIYWGNIYQLKNPEYLEAYADWAVANKEREPQRAEEAARYVAANPHATPGALHKLVEADLALTSGLKNPNLSSESKHFAASKDPEAARMVKIEELDKQFEGGLRSYLTVKGSVAHPLGPNRGLRDTTVQLDTAKVKELGLDREDVITLMGRWSYNGGYSYDESTGVFRGTVDSTD